MKKILFLVVFCMALTVFGQNRSDSIHVAHYDLYLNVDHLSQTIAGTATLSVVPKLSGLNSITLDLKALTVDSVKVNMQAATFNHIGEHLFINIGNYNLGDTVIVAVSYYGTPSHETWGGYYFSGNYSFNMGVTLYGNPHSFGRVWYPCIDEFTDKATYDFHIEAYADHKAICGGELVSCIDNPDGEYTKIWHWQLKQPVASYLTSIATGPYQLYTDTFHGMEKSIPIMIYVPGNYLNKVASSFIHLKQIAANYEENWGPIQFDRIGYVGVNFSGGAMEHATNIAYPLWAIDGDLNDEYLYAHELAHSWFGNLVTCQRAQEMWINEGFARYSEALTKEFIYSKVQYNNEISNLHASVLKNLYTDDGGYYALNNIPLDVTYGTHSYDKGGLTVHNLRNYLGDSLFFGGIKAMLNQFAFQNINSEELITFLSNYSGINLDGFYEAWINQPGFPHFSIDSIANEGNNQYTIYVRQRLFHAENFANDNHLDLTFFGSGMQRFDYPNFTFSGEYGEAHLSIPFEPQFGVVDYDNKVCDALIDINRNIKSTGTYNFSNADVSLYVSNIEDSCQFRIEHSYVNTDPFKSEIIRYRLNKHFWRIEYTDPESITAYAKFQYDFSNSSKIDYELMENLPNDSLVLLYRRNCADDWHSVPFTKNGQKTGFLKCDSLMPGEYTLAGKDYNASIDQINNSTHKIHIYPNPSTGIVNIESSESVSEVDIFDISGRKIRKENASSNNFSINISDLPTGIYIINIFNNKKELINSSKIAKL